MKWQAIIGQSREALTPILGPLGIDLSAPEEKKSYSDGTVYLCYYSLGIAFCFSGSSLALDSVDLYKSVAPYKCISEELLPGGELNVKVDDTAAELVSKFGEPIEKGGGRGMHIWLRWRHVEAQIPTSDWDTAKSTQWQSLTVF